MNLQTAYRLYDSSEMSIAYLSLKEKLRTLCSFPELAAKIKTECEIDFKKPDRVVDECSSCMCPLDQYQSINLPCTHKLHPLCFMRWYKAQHNSDIYISCPYCRTEFAWIERNPFKSRQEQNAHNMYMQWIKSIFDFLKLLENELLRINKSYNQRCELIGRHLELSFIEAAEEVVIFNIDAIRFLIRTFERKTEILLEEKAKLMYKHLDFWKMEKLVEFRNKLE